MSSLRPLRDEHEIRNRETPQEHGSLDARKFRSVHLRRARRPRCEKVVIRLVFALAENRTQGHPAALRMVDATLAREYQNGELVPGTPYRVVRLIGMGGMGCVYEVEHVELGRHYVLKSLLKSLSDRRDLIARMRNEWRALGRLSHPNIVDVLNAGLSASGTPFYVMELLLGETLRDRVKRKRRLEVPEASRVIRDLLLGLHAAHQIGLVHRDVKPANVFVTRDEVVKVLDFGIAKFREHDQHRKHGRAIAIGTPRYMSPEQAAGKRADARSDLYSVGLIAFELLAGAGPFDDASDVQSQMNAHLTRRPAMLSEVAAVPAQLSAAVARALSKDPDERPATAEEMATLFSAFADKAETPRWSLSPAPPLAFATSVRSEGALLTPDSPQSALVPEPGAAPRSAAPSSAKIQTARVAGASDSSPRPTVTMRTRSRSRVGMLATLGIVLGCGGVLTVAALMSSSGATALDQAAAVDQRRALETMIREAGSAPHAPADLEVPSPAQPTAGDPPLTRTTRPTDDDTSIEHETSVSPPDTKGVPSPRRPRIRRVLSTRGSSAEPSQPDSLPGSGL